MKISHQIVTDKGVGARAPEVATDTDWPEPEPGLVPELHR